MRSFTVARGLWFVATCALALPAVAATPISQPVLGTRSVTVLTEAGLQFRDLNRSGQLEAFEDWRLDAATRARDLTGRMTLAEKAGVMMHGTLPMDEGTAGRYDLARATTLIATTGVNSLITRLQADPQSFAEQANALQAIAENTRLGIPLTISTDPRHHFQYVPGASEQGIGFSQWPEALGFAAIGDDRLMRRFGEVARAEYRAVGIHEALSPQADLATEPRWPRINGTFGEDPQLAKRMVAAYVAGFQAGINGIQKNSVVAVVKHWAGYGAAKDGFDSHNHYGRFAVFPGGAFATHLVPFEGAFASRVGGVMPTYSILVGAGKNPEQVGAGYNHWLLDDLLRKQYGFDGVILSDWAITNDCGERCLEGFPPGVPPVIPGISTAWGVEHLSKPERFAKGVQAGLDQFGGTEEAVYLVAAVQDGKVKEARLDESVRRILEQKFRQGLFENPYVDPQKATRVVGSAAFKAEGLEAQKRALVLLENRKSLLPIKRGRKVYLSGISAAVARDQGFIVMETPEGADLAIVRATAPFEILHPTFPFGSRQHEGTLEFKPGNSSYELIHRLAPRLPTILTVYLDRPAILTNIRTDVAALIGNFGVSDAALFDVLTGKTRALGRLPFELPSSMSEVEAQASDVPHDTRHPLYPIGYGLRFPGAK